MGTSRLTTVPLAKRYRAPGAPFARKYTPGDVRLLVEMDKAHERVCGPAIAHLLQRAYTVYGDARYERLAELSSSHLYNLRKSGAGAELALLPQRLVGQDVLSGNLQRLFRQQEVNPQQEAVTAYAAYLPNRRHPRNVHALLKFLEQHVTNARKG